MNISVLSERRVWTYIFARLIIERRPMPKGYGKSVDHLTLRRTQKFPFLLGFFPEAYFPAPIGSELLFHRRH